MKTLLALYGATLVKAIAIHTAYVLVSVAIGFVLGLALGILLSRIPKWSGLILPVLSVLQTIPGLVFIGVLYIWWGGIYPTVIAALSVYAMFPEALPAFRSDRSSIHPSVNSGVLRVSYHRTASKRIFGKLGLQSGRECAILSN